MQKGGAVLDVVVDASGRLEVVENPEETDFSANHFKTVIRWSAPGRFRTNKYTVQHHQTSRGRALNGSKPIVNASLNVAMFRSIASATRPSLFQGTCNPAIVRRSFLSHRQHNSDATEEEIAAARKWVDEFHPEAIPKNIGEISFSRSSGPGGQNVNKYAKGSCKSKKDC